jgi:2-amino-4-hydroxy-6-hydroxymethyldihydropteridine diphosphokinase
MPHVFVGIGSNIDRENNIHGAVRELTARYGALEISPVYESQAVGFDGDNFYNLVVGFNTSDTLDNIKQSLSRIEQQFGRQRQAKRFCPRTLDLDLLLYGDVVQHDEHTKLPHPDIEHYAFVLRPLSEIAPDLRHPETGLPYRKMWEQFDTAKQEVWKANFNPRG